MTLELILFILYCICLRTSSIIHLVVMCLYTNCSQTLTYFLQILFLITCKRTIALFLLRVFENNHNATASSSVVVVLTLLTFRKREREEEKDLGFVPCGYSASLFSLFT